MLKKHLVLFESKDYGWIAYSTTGSDAKRILSVNKKYDIFYIFECDLLKEYPYIMKLKAPLNKHYDCKRINKYKEEIFLEKDESIIVSSKPDCQDEGIYFDIKYN
jgi:hypothetical protein